MHTPAPAVPIEGYLEMLQRFYEEEIEGAAFFDALADRYSEADHKRKMRLMAQVERYAAVAVAPLLAKYGLTPRDTATLRASGHEQAQDAPATWDALLSQMRQTFPGYITEFLELEALAPLPDTRQLKVLTAHEVAAIAFLEAEAIGDPKSDAALIRYLHTGTA